MPESEPTSGNIIVYATIEDPEASDYFWSRVESYAVERLTPSICEVFTEDWDEGLWEEEIEIMLTVVDQATDTVLLWEVVDGKLARTCLAPGHF